ncbi:cholesterol 24-hydroxylase-like [Synchiropus splendidus]|uniref:cholesterol 24-hydroxylase-like n=1 Tax=Synchiropus splendidus TaxID=270530 RepID=UPI00237E47D2|nr:cholesterol 24-hydroxylase-like [Synchiropus splendidus]
MAGFILTWAFNALLFLFFGLFLAFLCYCVYIKYIHMKYDHIPGPPRDSFLFGHSAAMTRALKSGEVLNDTFLQWAQTYGPVFKINAMHYVMVWTHCPETVKKIIMSPKYPKPESAYARLASLFGERFLGNGMVTETDHEKWYKQRRIMDPAFSSSYLRGLMGTFNDQAEKLMSKLSEVAESQCEVSMLHLVNCVTLNVIAKVAFGMELDLLKGNSAFPDAITTCLKGMVHHTRDMFFQLYPGNRAFIKKVREACRLLRVTGAKCIQDRKAAMQNGEDVPNDILTKIIETAGLESTTKEDEESMVDNFVFHYVAGQETTAGQLAFCIMELGRHPEILRKVRKEVDDVIGSKRDISYEDLGQLGYLSQVLKEVLRMYPNVPGTSRDIKEDMVINGLHIPGGFMCILDSYVAGRLDKFFKDPLVFDPDRFHPDAPKPYYCYFPFALGPRSCLGQNFAQMEAKVVMAKLLQRFDFTLTPGQTFDILDTGTLRPKGGVMCHVKPRHPNM